jgi:deoxyribodipyrimidine photolyase-related protein
MVKLVLVLGDQLSHDIAALQAADRSRDVVVMAEVQAEASYVRHHPKKIALVLSAIRSFAAELTDAGWTVAYTSLDDPANTGSIPGELQRRAAEHGAHAVLATRPGEWRLITALTEMPLPVTLLEDTRFIASHAMFETWARGRKQLRMEYFYREIRKRHGVLMEQGAPIGGRWNFDAENRKPPATGLKIPPTYACPPDQITREVMELVRASFPEHFGDLEPFGYAVTREGALEALDLFIETRLKHFGDYQDAMLQGEPWMYHSHISLYLNCGLLLPLECIERAEAAYHQGLAPLNAVEGFIRQILGWREYVRGLYWLKMPGYAEQNFLDAQRDLPQFYWDGQTQMNCLRQAVLETRQNAYAHHIQRLMVLGNFALLAGLDPDAVNNWYMLVYADAYDWVELPNVSGMVLFADGGVLASKPYAASGAYIKKMSNYCDRCSYKVSVKNGPKACPFNYLYWDFLDRNAGKLRGNPRLGFVYKTLDRMSEEKIAAVRDDARWFLNAL